MTSNIQSNIDLTKLLAGLEQPLQLMTDDDNKARIRTYIDAARPQVERAAFDVISKVVATFNDTNTDQRAILEYAGGGLSLRVEDVQDGGNETSFNDSDPERVTIRLPKELKELIDTAAERHGMSANNWYVRALSRAIARQARHAASGEGHEGHGGHGGRRRRGFYRGRGGGGRGQGMDGQNAD